MQIRQVNQSLISQFQFRFELFRENYALCTWHLCLKSIRCFLLLLISIWEGGLGYSTMKITEILPFIVLSEITLTPSSLTLQYPYPLYPNPIYILALYPITMFTLLTAFPLTFYPFLYTLILHTFNLYTLTLTLNICRS